MPGMLTAEEQKQEINMLLAQGVRGLAVSPIDEKAENRCLNDAAGKSALITLDNDAPQSNRICFIGTDNFAGGVATAKMLRSALPAGGAVMVLVGSMSAQTAIDRLRGLRYGLIGSHIRYSGVLTDNTDPAMATANALFILRHFPEVKGLVGLWGYDGPSILRAVRREHKTGVVRIVCWEAEPETIAGIRSGAIYGTIEQQPYQFGVLSVKYLTRAVRGDKSWVPRSRRIYVPVKPVTKANIDTANLGDSI